MARIGVLTGGGDCPGLNAVIRGIVRKGIDLYGHEIFGFRHGWKGVLDNDAMELTRENTSGILHRGGTILGTSRTNPYKTEDGEERVLASLKERGIDVLIPIGGDDTLGVARKLFDGRLHHGRRPQDDRQRPQRDRLHLRLSDRGADRDRGDRPPAHDRRVARPRHRLRGHGPRRRLDRLLLRHGRRRRRHPRARAAVRHRGGLRPHPPPPRDDRQDVLDRRRRRGRDAGRRRRGGDARPTPSTPSATPAWAGSPTSSSSEIEENTGFESRATVLGHVQRGGTPLAFDRVLGTRFGVAAIDAASDGDFGKMVALHGTAIELVALEDALQRAQAARPRAVRDRRRSSSVERRRRRRMRALVQRVSRAEVRVDGEVVARIGPGLLVLLGVTHDDDEARADRLADKVRALRVFPDAEGRMNEPLGDREVLCVSQFTLYGDTRKGNRPSYVAARARPGRRAAVRALPRAARRRRAGSSAPTWRSSSSTTARSRCCSRSEPPAARGRRLRAMPVEPRFVRASSPSPRRSRCPTAAGPTRSSATSSAPATPSTPSDEELGEPGEIGFYPDRTWHGRTYVPATARTSNGFELFGYVSFRPGDGGPRADGLRRRRRLHRRHRRGQPRLAARPLRRGRRHLARRGGQDSRT